jgi:alkylation response protein AidB-like acyl-CoA dehydrogenase
VDLNDSPDQARYRAKVRAWLEQHRDEAPVAAASDEAQDVAARRAWQGKLAQAGLAGVTWPVEFGGQGLGPVEHVILNQEILRAGVPNVLDGIGVGMLGPTIIAHGTEEQKNRYLGPLLHGDEIWCQLFSEPAAGSDLAGVQARATLQQDGSWRLSGQKVWTTNAHLAAHGMLLARTDPDVPKHKGLTMFIVPMDAEGVTVRPLRQVTGAPEFNEVFFDDVALSADAACGPVGGGWGTALTTLMFERLVIGLGSESMGFSAERYARAIASDPHAASDPEVRRRLGEVAIELLAVKFNGYRILSALQQGQIPGPESGLAKITTVRAAIDAADLIADVLGPEALEAGEEWEQMISYLPGLKSAGGTEEILRNTVGERVLGLPPEPRLDKGVPFSELRAKERAAVSGSGSVTGSAAASRAAADGAAAGSAAGARSESAAGSRAAPGETGS